MTITSSLFDCQKSIQKIYCKERKISDEVSRCNKGLPESLPIAFAHVGTLKHQIVVIGFTAMRHIF